jgi:transposase-like protein
MNIDDFHFSKRDSEKLVTDAKANETIANIELSRRHALNPPRTGFMKPSFSEMGKRSATARRLPEHEKLKAEAIRLHVELDYGINAISPRIGVNKISIRRWLIAAGCYRVGHRTTRVKTDGAKLIDCSPTDLGRKQIYVHVWQRRAWLDEWKGVAKWDEAKHWSRHPAKQNYVNVQSYREKRMKTK